MPRYFAFLRGINVGGHRVKMDRLSALFEDLGFENVATFIASGNVIFDSQDTDEAELERRIEKQLRTGLGFEAATFLRSAEELRAITQLEPFPRAELEKEGHSLFIFFMRSKLGAAEKRAIEAIRTERDEFRVHGRQMFWLSRGRIVESLVSASELGKATGKMECTSRNITTVRKLVAKVSAE
jgi:uncharacterized protein (DUF1697 family)